MTGALPQLVLDITRQAQESSADAFAAALRTVAAGATDLGGRPGAITLSTDQIPTLADGRLTGRASWIAPLADNAMAIVAGKSGDGLVACAVALDAPGVTLEPIATSALRGLAFGNANFDNTPCAVLGQTTGLMAEARVLLAAAALGMGRRALREGLDALHAQEGRPQGAGGEQTVQGLLADAATELEAAAVLIDKAAWTETPSLADASMAKLAATEATQRAVARATQVIGAASFTANHIVERLAQDVRALELFAGRTEALREAIAAEVLPEA
jgi:alkylation response protein AidB-like acyl-CoA dehydrogenase